MSLISFRLVDTWFLRYVDSYISAQHRASVLLLLELLFIREFVFSCSFLSLPESSDFVDFIICTA